MGSWLKFCLVAEGKADLYLRDLATMERDMAAAPCVVEGAWRRLLTQWRAIALRQTWFEELTVNSLVRLTNSLLLSSGSTSQYDRFSPVAQLALLSDSSETTEHLASNCRAPSAENRATPCPPRSKATHPLPGDRGAVTIKSHDFQPGLLRQVANFRKHCHQGRSTFGLKK